MLEIAQIESIAKTPGIDVLFVGPFDLGNSIGHPILDGTMHAELKEAIAKVLEAAKHNEKKTGIYCTSGEQARDFADQGFHMVRSLGPRNAYRTDCVVQVSVIADFVAVQTFMTQALATANGSYVHSALKMAGRGLGKVTGPYGR